MPYSKGFQFGTKIVFCGIVPSGETISVPFGQANGQNIGSAIVISEAPDARRFFAAFDNRLRLRDGFINQSGIFAPKSLLKGVAEGKLRLELKYY